MIDFLIVQPLNQVDSLYYSLFIRLKSHRFERHQLNEIFEVQDSHSTSLVLLTPGILSHSLRPTRRLEWVPDSQQIRKCFTEGVFVSAMTLSGLLGQSFLD